MSTSPSLRARIAETVAATAGGAALSTAAGALVGMPLAAAAVGAANGAISGWRGVYDWSSATGRLAFALDSTWALPTTSAAVVAHTVGVLRGDARYAALLSRRQNRHVYGRGMQLRRGFATTYGNVVAGAGDVSQPRRARLVTDHENVHVWQSRWFGPLFPVLYGGWMVGAGAFGAVAWLAGKRPGSFSSSVESAAYYLNPFEYWAYSRDANWPPTGLVAGVGPRRPIVRPFTS